MEQTGMRSNQIEMTPEQAAELDKAVERILQERKEKRIGSRVFCVACGASKRVPLRKWKNVYICSDCWKVKERIGDERYMKALRGED